MEVFFKNILDIKQKVNIFLNMAGQLLHSSDPYIDVFLQYNNSVLTQQFSHENLIEFP